MNDLIAKLYDQAIVIKDGGDWTTGELDPVKFAELIVQECIRLCDQVDVVGADECIDNIKEHFGVRE